MEEIDLIFAKGYVEKISYVKASQEMPFLNDREIEAMSRQYGFIDSDEETRVGEKGMVDDGLTETAAGRRSERSLQMHDETEGGLRND